MKTQGPISEYLFVSPKTLENANYNRSASGLESHIADYYIKLDTLNELYPPWVGKMFSDGDFHVHNLSKGRLPYCFGADLMLLLMKGMITDTVIGRPAKHFDTALDHIINFMATNQQEWAGAQAISHLNTLLAPFVYYDGLSYRQIKQALQRAIFNWNFPSRSGYQTVFSNVIFDFRTPKYYKELDVIIGGKPTGDCYDDFLEESSIIHQAFWEILNEGDGNGNIFTFPIPTLNLTKDIDMSTPLMDEIIKNEINRGQAYWMNYWGSGIDENTIRAMCCHVNLDLSELSPAGGRWAYEGGIGSIGVVTLNMGRIGYLSKNDDEIFERIHWLMNKAKDILLIKGDIIQSSKDHFRIMPLARYYDINFDRFFRTIGMLGFDELFLNYTGSHLSENVSLAKKILEFMRDITKEFQEQTGYLFHVEMTPGEGSSWTLAIKDKIKYPDIITSGIEKGWYYSAMVPPSNQDLSFMDSVTIANRLLKLFTGGTVYRVLIGENKPSVESMKKLITKLGSKTQIPYFDLAATFSRCQNPLCKNEMRGEYYECTKCGGETKIYSRVVGFYRSHNRYNPGKLGEFRDRRYTTVR